MNREKEAIQLNQGESIVPNNGILKEVELRLTLENQDQLNNLVQVLKSFDFVFKGIEQESDTYFNGPRFIEDKICLRIRQKSGYIELTYKGPSEPGENGFFSKEELNLTIQDPETATKIFTSLGYPKLVTVNKTRHLYRFEDITLSIDHIENVGSFIEIEILSTDPIQARQKILDTQSKLGLNNLPRTTLPYRDLVIKSNKK